MRKRRYKGLYEDMKQLVTLYQDFTVPRMREVIDGQKAEIETLKMLLSTSNVGVEEEE